MSEREEERFASLLRAVPCSEISRRVDVFHTFPRQFPSGETGGARIGRTMFETDRIPEDWVEACNRMDEVWVPSEFNRRSFASSGVRPEKLAVIPGALDTDRFHLGVAPRPFQGQRGFTFLSVFDWTLRKGWDVLLAAFAEEFSAGEDVTLVLKVWSSLGLQCRQIQELGRKYLRQLGTSAERQPNILLLEADIPTAYLPGIYRAVDAFVLPTRGEGWGRPLMEAMAMGLPTIATRCSGQLEFMNDDNSFLVDCQESPVSEQAVIEAPHFRGHHWAEPSRRHLRALMRTVFEERSEARRKGEVAREEVRERFDRRRVARQVDERLQRIAGRLQTRWQPALPAGDAAAKAGADSPGIVWEGDQFVNHSLALVNRELCVSLIRRGVDFRLLREQQGDPMLLGDPAYRSLLERDGEAATDADLHVRLRWPPDFSPPASGRLVMMQPWEYFSIPRSWVEPMQQAAEVWVPTQYVRDGYVHSGVPADRVHVIPCGVDCDRFHPGASPLRLRTDRGFRFLFVGGTLMRKGIDLLLRAYQGWFRDIDDVCLVVKDMGTQSFYRGQTFGDQIRRFQKLPQAPAIEYIEEDLSPDELAGLYAACDCLVHPYRGEGFGLPIAEAMATELAVITTRYGAALDFCDEQAGYLIDAREIRLKKKMVGDLETVDFPRIASVDVVKLGAAMQRVVADRREAQEKGARARERIMGAFTWDHAAEKVCERLDILRRQPARRRRELRKFIILSSPRSGTHMLRTSLDRHPHVVCLTEMFNPDYTEGRFPFSIDTPAERILSDHIFREYGDEIQAVGFCIHRSGARTGDHGPVWDLLKKIPDLHVISLRRQNLLRRYVSFQLRNVRDLTAERPDPLRIDTATLIADFERQREITARFDEDWADHPLLAVSYEDLCYNFDAAIEQIEGFLGISRCPLRPATAKRRMKPLSSTIHEFATLQRELRGTEWERFLDE